MTEKSANNIVSGVEAVCEPEVPVTDKMYELAARDVRLLTVSLLVSPTLTEAGSNEHVTAAPLHSKGMASVNSLGPAAEIVNVVVSAGLTTVTELGLEDKENTAMPFPDILTEWGLPEALSVTITLPSLSPLPSGRNETLIKQLAPAGRVAGQVLIWVKSLLTSKFVMLNSALPVFVNVTV